MARVRRRRWLPVPALAQSVNQFLPPPFRPRLLVAQRLREATGQGRGQFHREFEDAVVRYAERYRVDGVLCGHIHSAAIRKIGDVTYYNSGDWVETCSALVEHFDGRIEIVRKFDHGTLTPEIRPAPLVDAMA